MWNLFKNKERNAQEQIENAKRSMAIRAEKKQLASELLTISINNVRYLQSLLITLQSVANTVKGETPRETRIKRVNVRHKITYYKAKLEEERNMVIFYKHQTLKL